MLLFTHADAIDRVFNSMDELVRALHTEAVAENPVFSENVFLRKRQEQEVLFISEEIVMFIFWSCSWLKIPRLFSNIGANF